MKSYTFTIGENNFQERERLNEFGVDEKGTLNNALFDVLFQFQYVSRSSNMEKIILGLFNKAYYICSLILSEPRPYFNLQKYKGYAGKLENDLFDADKYVIVMSMVSVYLSTLDKINKDIERTISVIKSDLSKYSGSEYRKIYAVCSGRAGETMATQFSLTQVHVKEVESDQLTNCLIRNSIDSDAINKLNLSLVKNNEKDSINIGEQEELLNNENNEIDKLKESIVILKKQVEQLTSEKAALEKRINELVAINASLEKRQEEMAPEHAFNAAGKECFTNKQMGILIQAVGIMTEKPAPGKTTLGEIVEKISGYKATTVSQNMKGTHSEADKEAVAKAIESKFPNLAAKIRKL